jgi:hypothetical protein
MEIAATHGHLEIIKILKQYGVDISVNNDIALRLSSKYGYYHSVYYLIHNGANVFANNNEAYKNAIENDNLDIAHYIEKIMINLYHTTLTCKPDDIIFRKCDICPISMERLEYITEKIGCDTCLNVFKKDSLMKWFKMKGVVCPFKCGGCNFYTI